MITIRQRKSLKVDPSTHELFQQLKYNLNSPSADALIHFLIKQHNNIVPAERTRLYPKTFSKDIPETRPSEPVRSIRIGADHYLILKNTKKDHHLDSLDAALARYLYEVTDTPSTLNAALEEADSLKKYVKELEATIDSLVTSNNALSTLTRRNNHE